MIDEEGRAICDFCGGDIGQFDFEVGNHVACIEIDALRKRVAELEAALKPFADYKECIMPEFDNDETFFCIADFRRAAALLTPAPAPEPVAAPVNQPHTPHLGTPALSRYAAEQVAHSEAQKRDERQGKK